MCLENSKLFQFNKNKLHSLWRDHKNEFYQQKYMKSISQNFTQY